MDYRSRGLGISQAHILFGRIWPYPTTNKGSGRLPARIDCSVAPNFQRLLDGKTRRSAVTFTGGGVVLRCDPRGGRVGDGRHDLMAWHFQSPRPQGTAAKFCSSHDRIPGHVP